MSSSYPSSSSPTSPLSGRTFEIWSSRVQRELLSLSTTIQNADNAGSDDVGQVGPAEIKTCMESNLQDAAVQLTVAEPKNQASPSSSSSSSSSATTLLPDYLHLHSHDLRMEQGICRLTFQVTLSDLKTEILFTQPMSVSKEREQLDPEQKLVQQKDVDTDTNANTKTVQQQLLFVIDAPLTKVGGSSGAIDATRTYPFVKPTALLLQGSHFFINGGQEVLDGDEIDIDCDWTPSLHLTDAAIHVALKLRELLKKGEPFITVSSHSRLTNNNINRKINTKSLDTVATTAKEKLTHTVQNTSQKFSSFITAIKSKASEIGADIDKAMTSSSSPSSSNSPIANVATSNTPPPEIATPKKHSVPVIRPSLTKLSGGIPIDLTQEPWCKATMYSIKTLQRPVFIQQFLDHNNSTSFLKKSKQEDEDDYSYNSSYQPTNYMALQAGGMGTVAKSGVVGIGSMFKSFTQSAKNLVEETYLMLTNDLILEIKCNKFSLANATVVFSVPVSFLCKLKFRRQESISFIFKDDPDDPLIYMCPNSAEAVKHVQSILKVHGVKGKHTNVALARSIQRALDIIADIQMKEKTLEEEPTVERVQDIMDLFRQAAEIFDFADDPRHEEVVNLLHKFLARPVISSILDGTYDCKKKESPTSNSEELANLQTGSPSTAYDEDFQKSIQEAEEMLRMAHDDLTDFEGDDVETSNVASTQTVDEISMQASKTTSKLDLHADGKSLSVDTMSELEDMLKNVDQELEELIK